MRLGVIAVIASVRLVGYELRDGMRKHTPKKTWLMHRKCKVVSTRATSWKAYVKVGWKRGDFPRGKFYPYWVGEGTGVFGPHHRRITARKKGKVRTPMIRYSYGGGWVSLKSVSGRKPTHVLEKGLVTATPDILSLLSRTMFHTLRMHKYA